MAKKYRDYDGSILVFSKDVSLLMFYKRKGLTDVTKAILDNKVGWTANRSNVITVPFTPPKCE